MAERKRDTKGREFRIGKIEIHSPVRPYKSGRDLFGPRDFDVDVSGVDLRNFEVTIDSIRKTGKRIDERFTEIDNTRKRVETWLNRRLQQQGQ